MTNWLPMETAPKGGQDPLWLQMSGVAAVGWWGGDRWITNCGDSKRFAPPTGWMPLPYTQPLGAQIASDMRAYADAPQPFTADIFAWRDQLRAFADRLSPVVSSAPSIQADPDR